MVCLFNSFHPLSLHIKSFSVMHIHILSLIFLNLVLLQANVAQIQYEEEFIVNARGIRLFTCRWAPVQQQPRALIFICHGYAMECSFTMNSTATRLANEGFAVYGIDYEGHGRSEGLPGFVNNFDDIIDDCSNHFTSICEKPEHKKKMRCLLGESMGGVVALLLHKKEPEYWHAAILVAPMLRIADEMRSNAVMIIVLTLLSKVFPTWKLTPTQDIIDIAFKVPQVREQIRINQFCYKGRTRLKTAYELLRMSSEIEQRLREVSLPFLVLQGGGDRVIDKSMSRELHRVASSPNKTIRWYQEMWHGLLYGEPPENLNIVFNDIIHWLNINVQGFMQE